MSSGITSGSSYKFKYRAYNVHGWGEFSDPLTILAAEIPQDMGSPTVSLVGTDVRISWTPLSNNGAAIT